MKISLNWVSQYVDLTGISSEEIANRLTFAGIEVEGIHSMAKGTLLTTGRVLKCEPVEGSGHLSLLQVDLGPVHGLASIICGAPNVKKDQIVIVALPGAELIGGKISKTIIKGHESQGMVCSLIELGVDAKYLTKEQIDGIEVLDPKTLVGDDQILSHLGLVDTILDIKVLANRPDCLSLYNVAAEIGTLFNRPLKPWAVTSGKKSKSNFTVKSLTTGCPQFSIKVIKGLHSFETPLWMSRRLMAMGIRSISPLVDIGNYVMLLTGQPLHIYDLDKLPSNSFEVNDNFNGPFLALDNKTYQLQVGDICISSGGQVLCLGGIMGSKASEVDEKTKSIVIESARFNSATIRRTSIRLNLGSESSTRFIKGINPTLYCQVLDFTASLISELGGFLLEEATVSYDPNPSKLRKVEFSHQRINNLLGTQFDKKVIEDTLASVGVNIIEVNGVSTAVIPSKRIDIEYEADLAEEVIRLQGFKHINSSLPRLSTSTSGLSTIQRRKKASREYLLGRGLDETISYTLVSEQEKDLLRFLNQKELFRLEHPMTDERVFVRGGLSYSLLKTVSYNLSHQNKDLALFEISEIETVGEKATHLAVALCGNKKTRGLLTTKPYDFYDMKGILQGLMLLLGIDEGRYQLIPSDENESRLHPGRSAIIQIENKLVGVIGELSPKLSTTLNFGKSNIILMELKLSTLLNIRISTIKMTPLSKFPSVERDLAFLIDKNIDSSNILRTIRKTNKGLIDNVEIFDVYEGTNVPENKKSMAIRIWFSDSSKTLTESDITQMMDRVKETLAQAFNLQFRV